MAVNKKYRRGGGPRSLAALADRLIRPVFGRRGFADGAILTDWETIVGPALAAHCLPEKVTFPARERSRGTLTLRVDAGALATELQHLEPVLIERINGHFGYNAIARLKLLHGPLPPKKDGGPKTRRPLTDGEEADLARRVSAVTDPELRAALESLGRAIASGDGER